MWPRLDCGKAELQLTRLLFEQAARLSRCPGDHSSMATITSLAKQKTRAATEHLSLIRDLEYDYVMLYSKVLLTFPLPTSATTGYFI